MKMAINKTPKTSCTIIKPKQAVCFGLKNTKPNDKLTVDAAARIEKQTITMDYDKDAIYQSLNLGLATAHEPDIRFKRLLDSGTLNPKKTNRTLLCCWDAFTINAQT